jgi:predicted unusual protein kinase regulating ubiquinone biosynthesis (AarF/ABC1/UbiB family)
VHCLDLKIIRAIGYLFYLIPGSPFTSLKEAIDTFSSEMYHQTNLQEEGKNTQCFHSKLCGMRLRSSSGRIRCNVKIPQIFEKYSTDSVLFETYEDGIALGEFMRLCSDSIDIKKSKEKTKLLSDPKDVTHCNISQKTMSYQNQNDLFLKKKNTSQKVYETASFLFKVIHDVVRERFQNRLDACKEILHHVAAKYGFVPENENEKKDFTSANFRKALTEIGFNLFLTMVFQHRLIHADMHPENILIRFPTLEKRDQTVNNSCLDAKNFLQRVQHIYSQNVQVYKNQLQKSVPLQDPTSEKLSTRKSLIFKSFYSPAVPQNVDFEIVLIDFGLMTKLCEKNYTNIKDVLYSVCLQDGYNIGNLVFIPLVKHSIFLGELLLDRSQCTTCTNRHEFCQNIQDLLNEYFESRGGNITLKNIELGKFFFKVLRIATKYRVQLDSSFLSVCFFFL